MTRILIADDHPMIRTAIEVLLRDTNYEMAGTASRVAMSCISSLSKIWTMCLLAGESASRKV